jgi:hypothetical protein
MTQIQFGQILQRDQIFNSLDFVVADIDFRDSFFSYTIVRISPMENIEKTEFSNF